MTSISVARYFPGPVTDAHYFWSEHSLGVWDVERDVYHSHYAVIPFMVTEFGPIGADSDYNSIYFMIKHDSHNYVYMTVRAIENQANPRIYITTKVNDSSSQTALIAISVDKWYYFVAIERSGTIYTYVFDDETFVTSVVNDSHYSIGSEYDGDWDFYTTVAQNVNADKFMKLEVGPPMFWSQIENSNLLDNGLMNVKDITSLVEDPVIISWTRLEHSLAYPAVN